MNLDSLIIGNDELIANIDQADIFKDIYFSIIGEKMHGILVTPTCDLSRMTVGAVLFCAVNNLEYIIPEIFEKNMEGVSWAEFVEHKKILTAKQLKHVRGQILEPLLNNKYGKFHWLGKIPNEDGFWCVNFSMTACYLPEKVALNNRIASLKSPLRESVSAGYANYMNRVGLPWEKEERMEIVDEILNLLAPGVLPKDNANDQ